MSHPIRIFTAPALTAGLAMAALAPAQAGGFPQTFNVYAPNGTSVGAQVIVQSQKAGSSKGNFAETCTKDVSTGSGGCNGSANDYQRDYKGAPWYICTGSCTWPRD